MRQINHVQLAVIINNVRSTYNVGSIFRSADCMAIDHIFISGYTPYPTYPNDNRLPHIAEKLHKQIHKAALGAELSVPFSVHVSIQEAVSEARSLGYAIATLEQHQSSKHITNYKLRSPLALVLGNEVTGNSAWTIDHSDVILEIPQYGTKESFNVASACAIAMYALRHS